MKCKINIEMDNTAFDEYPEVELNRILKKLAHDLDVEGLLNHSLRDINGNTVGTIKITGRRLASLRA
jgi:hypothetical protein